MNFKLHVKCKKTKISTASKMSSLQPVTEPAFLISLLILLVPPALIMFPQHTAAKNTADRWNIFKSLLHILKALALLVYSVSVGLLVCSVLAVDAWVLVFLHHINILSLDRNRSSSFIWNLSPSLVLLSTHSFILTSQTNSCFLQ